MTQPSVAQITQRTALLSPTLRLPGSVALAKRTSKASDFSQPMRATLRCLYQRVSAVLGRLMPQLQWLASPVVVDLPAG